MQMQYICSDGAKAIIGKTIDDLAYIKTVRTNCIINSSLSHTCSKKKKRKPVSLKMSLDEAEKKFIS